jgi:flavin reductase (DIM6/NTAB) family NADH-FMN oxidoreductase RutF
MRAMGRTIAPPHVGESAYSMECNVMHWYDMEDDNGKVTGTLIVGRVKRFHVVSAISPVSQIPYPPLSGFSLIHVCAYPPLSASVAMLMRLRVERLLSEP